ncbi:hypothetical protein D1007_18549 [Hordeum vulgare]|nr:hypothetical protein D1007_18549 [Hordeum vulgare]KAI4987974.1 hypothetical protein ZWY2020_029604 [Hordeum vulgare]
MEEVRAPFSVDDQRLLQQHPPPMAQEDYDALDWWTTREPVSPSGVPEELWGLRFLAALDHEDEVMMQEDGKGEPSSTSSEVPEEFRWLFLAPPNDGAAVAPPPPSPAADAQLLPEEGGYDSLELDQWMHGSSEPEPWSAEEEEDYDALDDDEAQ